MTINKIRITGIVELVLDERELLIDKGKDEGVQTGMRFVVLGKSEAETASGRAIQVEFPKVIVKIVRFDSGLAVGRTFRVFKGRPARKSFTGTDSVLGEFRGTPDRVETISASNKNRFRESLSPEDLRVIPGDPVRETRGDEYLDEE